MMPYPESEATSSANFGARSIAESSQNQSTSELIAPGGPHLANTPAFPVYRDSINLSRARTASSTYQIFRVKAATPPSPWPFRNATPRESLGSINVSALTSSPPSLQARSVSDLSEMDETERPVTPPPLTARPVIKTQKSVTIDVKLPSHRSKASSILAGRPPTPMPSPSLWPGNKKNIFERIKEAASRQKSDNETTSAPTKPRSKHNLRRTSGGLLANRNLIEELMPLPSENTAASESVQAGEPTSVQVSRGMSKASRATVPLSQIHRMPTPELANARYNFFNQPQEAIDSAVNLTNADSNLGRHRSLIRRNVIADAAYIKEAFSHPRVLIISGITFIIVFMSFVIVISIIAAYNARGIEFDYSLVIWAILNTGMIIFSGIFLYAVASHYQKARKLKYYEVEVLRTRAFQQARRVRDLEGEIEMANLGNASLLRRLDSQAARHDQDNQQRPDSDQNTGHVVVRVLPPNAARQCRPGTPEYPTAPPPTPASTWKSRKAGGLLIPGQDEGVSPSPSEASILTQLCEGVMANGRPAGTTTTGRK